MRRRRHDDRIGRVYFVRVHAPDGWTGIKIGHTIFSVSYRMDSFGRESVRPHPDECRPSPKYLRWVEQVRADYGERAEAWTFRHLCPISRTG